MKFRKQIQMIFQDPYSSLNGRLKVKDIIAEPITLHNPSISNSDLNNYVNDLLDSVEMTQKSADRYPHEFSGGQRQRICIARALTLEPSIIIADEPVSALDVSIQSEILELLESLRGERKLAFLFISHDLSVVRNLCDRVAVMFNGKIVETGIAKEVIDNPKHEYTQKLVNAVPSI